VHARQCPRSDANREFCLLNEEDSPYLFSRCVTEWESFENSNGFVRGFAKSIGSLRRNRLGSSSQTSRSGVSDCELPEIDSRGGSVLLITFGLNFHVEQGTSFGEL
jgi:hypothetical protein